jgi:hypothetical protein
MKNRLYYEVLLNDAAWIRIVVYLITLVPANSECRLFLELCLKLEWLIIHIMCSTNLVLLNRMRALILSK